MKKYKNLILDLGGVVFDIDYKLTMDAFRKLGIDDAAFLYSKSAQTSLFDDLEKGLIKDNDFFSEIRRLSGADLTNEQIQNAWNALLIGLPDENVSVIEPLGKSYRLFLLSNTNSIHESAYRKMIIDKHGSFVLEHLFEKMYLSHHLHLRKPDDEIFIHVLKDAGINPAETLFIDDSPQHVSGAARNGINAFHLAKGNLAGLADELEL